MATTTASLTTTATVTSEGLVLPLEFMAEHNLKPGTRVALTFDGSQVFLEKLDDTLIDDLCGVFAGGPSMADELIRERREEHAREQF